VVTRLPSRRPWTFLSNHAHVLVCIAEDPATTVRELARRVGITERAAATIIGDLETEGYLTRERVGRNNRYHLHTTGRLRHPIEQRHRIGELLELVANGATEPEPGPAAATAAAAEPGPPARPGPDPRSHARRLRGA
jgi:DNA-binding MarR family transcriptional regulator